MATMAAGSGVSAVRRRGRTAGTLGPSPKQEDAMSVNPPVRYVVLVVLVVVVAIAFDSPTSVFILVGIALVGVALETMGRRTPR